MLDSAWINIPNLTSHGKICIAKTCILRDQDIFAMHTLQLSAGMSTALARGTFSPNQVQSTENSSTASRVAVEDPQPYIFRIRASPMGEWVEQDDHTRMWDLQVPFHELTCVCTLALCGSSSGGIERKNPPSPYRDGMFPKICVADLRSQIALVLQEDKGRSFRPIMEPICHAVGRKGQPFAMLNN